MSATLPVRPTRTTVDTAAIYAAAKSGRNALVAYLESVEPTLVQLLADVAAAREDLLAAETDMLRIAPEWALSDGITPPPPPVVDAPAPTPATPAKPAPRLASLGNRPPLVDCARRMSNRTSRTGNVYAPALDMLLAAVGDAYGAMRDVSPAHWAVDGSVSRSDADQAAKARWHAAGFDFAKLSAFADAMFAATRDGAVPTWGDVLDAYAPGADYADTALALAEALA